jgi:hypothetical protein
MAYRLNEILEGFTVYVVEGEPDADRLWSLGFPATTVPAGAMGWRQAIVQALKGKHAVILPVNDPEGEAYSWSVRITVPGVVSAVTVVRLPRLPEHGTVSDWFDAGHTADELTELVERRRPGTAAGRPWEVAKPPQGEAEPLLARLRTLVAEMEAAGLWWRATSRKVEEETRVKKVDPVSPRPKASFGNTRRLRRLADIEPEEVEFLWCPYIPWRKVTLLEGDGGVGKSHLVLALAAHVSLGHGLPGVEATAPGTVLLLTAEDGAGDTVRPRLERMAADLTQIHIEESPLC